MIEARPRPPVEWLRPERVALAAIFVGAVSALQSFAMSRARSPSATLPNALTVHLTFWLVWAACVPLVMRASAAIARRQLPMPARLACHLTVGTVLSLGNATVVYGMRMLLGLIGPSTALWREIAGFASWQLSADLLAYGLIASGYHLSRSYAAARDRELLEARLRGELAAARLETLRGQLHPHFLFNTLNSISALVEHDAVEARRAVALLGDLLRRSLDATEEWRIVAEELRCAELYLAIEGIRYGERLETECLADERVLNRSVPCFVLLPLVENAVKHGVARHRGAARVRLEASSDDDGIVLAVTNSGTWRDARGGVGTGLTRLRRRLDELYGGDAQLRIEDAGEGLVRVSVRIPAPLPAVATRQ
jgi:hypothetical protein